MDWGVWQATVHGLQRVRHDWVNNTFPFRSLQYKTTIFNVLPMDPCKKWSWEPFSYQRVKTIFIIILRHYRHTSEIRGFGSRPLQWSKYHNKVSHRNFFGFPIHVKVEEFIAQSRPTLWDPMDCSPQGSSVHGILQARILEWGAISFSNIKVMSTLYCSLLSVQ